MDLFTIKIVMAVLFAVCCDAAPQYAVDNYDLLNDAIRSEYYSLGPEESDYIRSALSGTNTLKQAVESGDRCRIVQTLLESAENARANAYHTISVPALYRLMSGTGPNELEQLAYDIAAGRKSGQDVTNTIGVFAVQVREALQHPNC